MPTSIVESSVSRRLSEFGAPWTRLLIGISSGATVVLLGVGVAVWVGVPSGASRARWLVPTAILLTLVSCALFTVRGYRLEGRTLLVKRWFWWTHVSLEGLREANVDPEAMTQALRICGNGGVYSFSGWYWSKRLGRFRAYVTDLHRTVLLTFPHGRIVLSPDRPEAFVEALTRNRQLRG